MSTFRSREELGAAAAALTGFVHECDDHDAAALASTRAKQFEQEALDAPPAHLVPDDHLLRLVGMAAQAGVTALFAPSGVPEHISFAAAQQASRRLLGDPMSRDTLLDSARHLIAGRCVCGELWGHDEPHPDEGDGGAL